MPPSAPSASVERVKKKHAGNITQTPWTGVFSADLVQGRTPPLVNGGVYSYSGGIFTRNWWLKQAKCNDTPGRHFYIFILSPSIECSRVTFDAESVSVHGALFLFITDTHDAITAGVWGGKSLCYSEFVVASYCTANRGAILDAERIKTHELQHELPRRPLEKCALTWKDSYHRRTVLLSP